MTMLSSNNAMAVLRWTLGLVIAFESVRTAWMAFPEIHEAGHHGAHAWIRLVLGSLEAVGAVLFLLPATVMAGGWILLAVFAVAFLFHALGGEFRGDLLIYAVAALACMAYAARAKDGNSGD
ncbi:MAG TPA: hypothetical protein VGD60_19775 [Candidatus Acidoferrales bacterium]